jgi:hypothetical protein
MDYHNVAVIQTSLISVVLLPETLIPTIVHSGNNYVDYAHLNV